MSAHHFFLGSVDADTLVLEEHDSRHAVRVLRINPGETITVSDGRGTVATCRVTSAERTLEAAVLERRVVEVQAPAVTVYQALPKAGKLDEIVQSLVQTGVEEIVPVRTRRSIAKWDERKASAQHARLTTIAREAAMQSRRAYLPVVGNLCGLEVAPAGAIVLHEAATRRLHEALPDGPPARVSLVVGPEGGFDDEEVAAMGERGMGAASLGPTVFRTEVAALVATTLVLARYGRLG